jgi:hypothetical protein
LLAGREDVDDAVDGFGSAWGVKRSENEVAGCCGSQRQFDGFKIAHFPDENNVRVFAQGTAQSGTERLRVQSDFAMIYQASLALVHEFDRVLDSDDVILSRLVRVVHDRRKSRGLPAARWTRDEDESFMKLCELLHDRRQAQLFGSEDSRGDLPEDGSNAVLLVEEVRTEPGHARDLIAKVHVPGLFKDLYFVLGRDLIEHPFESIVLQRRVIDSLHFAPDSHDGLRARSQMQVRGPDLHHEVEKRVNLRHRPSQETKPGCWANVAQASTKFGPGQNFVKPCFVFPCS